MKLIAFLFLITMASYAAESYSQQTNFSMEYHDATLREVINEIEEKSEFIFIYSEESVDLDRKVNVSVDDKNVNAVLDQVFTGTNNFYKINDRQIAIMLKKEENISSEKINSEPTTQNQPKTKTITGTVVTNTNGEPLPGVSVIVPGTTIGTTTDFDGMYSLAVPMDADSLSFSFVGMKDEIVSIAGQNKVNVRLEETNVGLEEVVAIGYGVQKKSNVTGSISSVRLEDLANRSTSNAASALQGKVSGVQVMNISGAPGSSSTIRIRGFSSNGVSDPLYIVDGLKVPNIDYLDVDNIENIEVLKDGASAAIYGAEAGNGVVLITTKSGKKGAGKIFINTQNSFSSLANKLTLCNADEYINMLLEISPGKIRDLETYYYNDPTSYVNNKLANTDWQDAFYTTGYRQKYTVGFQGGNERGTLYVSLNYLDNDGIITGSNDYYKRISGQVNSNYEIKKWLNIGLTNSIESYKRKQVSESNVLESSATSQVYLMNPLTPVEYSDGMITTRVDEKIKEGYSPLKNPETGNYYGIASPWASGQNPLAILEKDKNNYTNGFRVNGTLYANLTPFKNFEYTSRLGYRLNYDHVYEYTPPYMLATVTALSQNPSLTESQTGLAYYQWENFANYKLEVNNHSFDIMGGMSYINSNINTMESGTNELESLEDNFLYLDYSSTTANDEVSGNSRENVQIAYYGRLSWNYADKYNLQFNFRADSYDAAYLDLDHNWGYFPSVSAGWTLSNEKFMEGISKQTLSFAKLRVSYGKNGSISNLGNYMYSSTMYTGNMYYMNNRLNTGIYPSEYLANPNLRWEESVQFNAGVDLRLFKDRLSLTADFFNKDTDGMLVSSTASLITGTSSVYQNVGVINNKGFEVELGWKDQIGKKFHYNIRGNISRTSNIVKEYKGEGVRLEGSSVAHSKTAITYFEEGYPVWYLRGYQVESINPEDGQPIYKDLDGVDGITDADRTMIGSGIPKFSYGTTISLSYSNFDFQLYGVGAYGNEIFWGIVKSLTVPDTENVPKFLYDERWTTENPNATRPAPLYYSDSKYTNSDALVFDGSYFKIKQIQLGYSLPQSLIKKIDMSALRIYVSLDDFFTFTPYPGLDPEVRPDADSSMALDFGGYPVPKSVMFGVNITF